MQINHGYMKFQIERMNLFDEKKPANFNHTMTLNFDLRSMDSLHGFIRETLSMDDFAHDFSLALFIHSRIAFVRIFVWIF